MHGATRSGAKIECGGQPEAPALVDSSHSDSTPARYGGAFLIRAFAGLRLAVPEITTQQATGRTRMLINVFTTLISCLYLADVP